MDVLLVVFILQKLQFINHAFRLVVDLLRGCLVTCLIQRCVESVNDLGPDSDVVLYAGLNVFNCLPVEFLGGRLIFEHFTQVPIPEHLLDVDVRVAGLSIICAQGSEFDDNGCFVFARFVFELLRCLRLNFRSSGF